MIGLAVLTPFFRKDLACSRLREVCKNEWAALMVSTLLYSVVGPWFDLQALTLVTVTTSAVLARFQSVLWFVLSIAVLKTPFNWWDATNTALTLLGIVLSIALIPAFGGRIDLGLGHLYVIISVTAYAFSLTIAKKWLKEVSIGLMVVFRLGLGTVAYHIMAFVQGNIDGLYELYSPRLWYYMWWFGLVYAVGAQGMWLVGFQVASPAYINTITTAQFVLTLLCSIIIQRILPTPIQSIAAAVLTLSIASGIAKELYSQRLAPPDACRSSDTDTSSTDGETSAA